MNRKQFMKKGVLGLLGLGGITAVSQVQSGNSTPITPQVGFNHLPNHSQNNKTMKTILHRADTRGHANHGWLNTHHTFSFASYHNPERMNFGVLRVLNDDIITGGTGFGRHPHDNMEIISIPIKGALEHKDSMGNEFVIKEQDIQIMSAGTGVFHSEKNHLSRDETNFLQIWVFPKKRNIEPRYEQRSFAPEARQNKWQTVLSGNPEDEAMWINQDAYFSLAGLEAGKSLDYEWKNANSGIYIFLIDGSVEVAGQTLNKRDGLGVWDSNKVSFTALQDAQILLMEVPMAL